MSIDTFLHNHGVGNGGFQKNSFIPLESAGFTSEMITTFSSGSTSLDGGLAMDNAGNIYTIDQTRTLRKHSKVGAMLLSITLPTEMNTPTAIRMEYVPSLNRIVCFSQGILMVLDTSLNVLYNQSFTDVPNRNSRAIYVIRGKYFYHIMKGYSTTGSRMQKFDLEALAYVFDNLHATETVIADYSTLEVDSNDNFYGTENNQIHKYDKLGNKIWSATTTSNTLYIYFDKIDGKLYIIGSRMISGTVDPNTGAITYQNTENNVNIDLAQGVRSGGGADDKGIRLLKYTRNSWYPTVIPVCKNGGMLAATNVAQLANVNQSSNLYSVVSRKGVTAAVFQSSFQVYLFRTGVKIL